MCQKLVFLSFFLIVCSNIIIAQNTNGYDNMTWETSQNEFLKLYPNAQKTSDRVEFYIEPEPFMDYTPVGIIQYHITEGGNGIKDKLFYFYKDKLFYVQVNYDLTQVRYSDLKQRVESVYGKMTGIEPIEERYQITRSNQLRVAIEGDSILKNRNMRVLVALRGHQFDYDKLEAIALWVSYSNDAVFREVVNEYTKSQQNSIEL